MHMCPGVLRVGWDFKVRNNGFSAAVCLTTTGLPTADPQGRSQGPPQARSGRGSGPFGRLVQYVRRAGGAGGTGAAAGGCPSPVLDPHPGWCGDKTRGGCSSFCSLRSTAHAGTERVGGSWAGRPVRTAERWHCRCLGCSRGGPSRGCGLGTRLDIGGPGREGGGGSGRVRGLAWIQVELKRTRGAGKGDRHDGKSSACCHIQSTHCVKQPKIPRRLYVAYLSTKVGPCCLPVNDSARIPRGAGSSPSASRFFIYT